MEHALILILGIAAFIVVLFLLKVPASTYFLSVLAGKVLVDELAVTLAEKSGLSVINSNLILFLIPIILTIFFTRGRASHSKAIVNIVGYFLATAVFIYYVDPAKNILNEYIPGLTEMLNYVQKYIISAGVIYVLMLAFFESHSKKGPKHRK